jgi:hypothetical protein
MSIAGVIPRTLCCLLFALLTLPAAAQDEAPVDQEVVEAATVPEELPAEVTETESAEVPAEDEAAAEEAAADEPDTEAPEAEADAAAADAAVEEEPAKPKWIDGSFSAGIDAAFADGSSDIDADQTLRLRIRPPQAPNWQVTGSLWMTESLDGDEDKWSVLRDIDDGYDHDVRARLMHLYVQGDNLWGQSTLRIGRQRILESPLYNRIDGVYFRQYRNRWDWYGFGGVRASLYEDAHDDMVLGGGLGVRPYNTTRLGLDFFYADDHRGNDAEIRQPFLSRLLRLGYPRRVDEEESNIWYALSLYQDLTDNLQLYGRLSMVDDEIDQIVMNFNGYVPSFELTYQFTYRRQMDRVQDRVNDLTVYYRILGPLEEYDHFLLSLHKPLTQKLALSLEAELHEADSDSMYGGNRDYNRLAAILAADDLFWGVNNSIAVERWDTDDGEDAWILTGEMSKEWKQVKLTVGADYERWRDEIDEYQPWPLWLNSLAVAVLPGVYPSFTPGVWFLDTKVIETREKIYSFYTRLDWDVTENQEVSAKIIFERDDSPESPYWRVQAAYEIEF